MHVLGFVTLLSLVHVCVGQLSACYYYGGSPATNDVPCDPDASNSTCCGPGSMCGTNLYCFNTNDEEVAGSCTDQTWQSVDCPLASRNGSTNCSDGTICPNNNNQSCCEAHQGFSVISYDNTATIPSQTSDLSAYYANGGFSIPVTASAHPPSASNSLSMMITGATSASAVPTSARLVTTISASPTSSTVMKTLQILTSSAAETSPSRSSSSSSSGGLKEGASAGVGVGAALGVLIIGAAVIFFIYTRKKRKIGVVEKDLPGMMMVRG